MPRPLDQDEIENLLDKYERAVTREVKASIDAGCCGTSTDFRNLHKAENNRYKVKDEVTSEFCRAFGVPFESAAGENDPEDEGEEE